MKNSLIVTVMLLMFVSTKSYAFDKWSTRDTVLEVTSELVLSMDWNQTLQIKNHPDQHETNVMLGQHPTDQSINQYFLAELVLHPIVTYLLPEKVRPYFQLITIGYEGNAVYQNTTLGLKLGF